MPQAFGGEGERNPEKESDHKADDKIEGFPGTHRVQGRNRGVDDMHVGRAQARRDRCILEALKQAVVELLVGFKLVLQDVVLDQQLV